MGWRKGMKCLYIKIFCAAALCLILFSACAARQDVNHDETLAAVIASGQLLNAETLGPVNPEMMQSLFTRWVGSNLIHRVEVMDLVRAHTLPIQMAFARRFNAAFEREGNVLYGIFVEPGQFVHAGDVLAAAIHEPTPLLLEQHRQAHQAVAQWQQQTTRERDRLQAEIEAARDTWDVCPIHLALLELELEVFLFNAQQRHTAYQRQAEALDAQLYGEQITAPFDGFVSSVNFMQAGDPVIPNQTILVLEDVSSVMFTVLPGAGMPTLAMPLTADETRVVFRYGDVLPVEAAGHRFYVRVANDPFSAGVQSQSVYFLTLLDWEGFMPVLDAFDRDWLAVSRLVFNAHHVFHVYSQGMVIQPRAVQWDADRPFVWVVDESGRSRRRFITISNAPVMAYEEFKTGMNIFYAHVIEGLSPGEWVGSQ
jgi:biotin carboxyl carrier protein